MSWKAHVFRISPFLLVFSSACTRKGMEGPEVAQQLWVSIRSIPGFKGEMACAFIRRRDGNVFVMEQSTGMIHQLDGQGHFRSAFASISRVEGQQSGCVFGGWRGGDIWAYDPAAARIRIIRLQPGRTSELPVWFAPLAGTGPGMPRAAGQGGEWLVEYMPPGVSPESPDSTELIVTRNELNASPLDTVARFLIRHGVLRLVRGNTAASLSFQPFSDDPLVEFSSHGDLLVVLDRRLKNAGIGAQEFTVTVTSRTGVLSQWSQKGSTPSLDKAMINRFIGPKAADLVRRGLQSDSAEAYHWLHSSIYLPRVSPVVDGLVVGRDTTIWVRWFRPNPREVQAWSGFHLSGVPFATAQAPPEFIPFEASRTALWGLLRTSPNQEAGILRIMATAK